MKIDSISIRDFLLFTGERTEKFIDGINVLIGANGIGKSTLLKCLYAACEFSNQKSRPQKEKKFSEYFTTSGGSIKEGDFGLIQVYGGGSGFECRDWDNGMTGLGEWESLNIKSILIPTAEMLSHSKGLLAMASKYNGVPFDSTQLDILVNAQLWETKEISERNNAILCMIGEAIDGEVLFENDTFYIVKSNGLKVEFSLEADGYRKLGLLWKLIRNGLLERGSILFWDEPEASMNPGLIPLLVDILYMLKNDGVQLFLATHNYTLAKYIDLKKQNDGETLFISMHKDEDGQIITSRADQYASLMNNPIEASEERLYDAVIEKSLGM